MELAVNVIERKLQICNSYPDHVASESTAKIKREIEDADVTPAERESRWSDDTSAQDQVWRDRAIHTEEHFVLNKTEEDFKSYLSFDLLPSCSVLLQRVKTEPELYEQSAASTNHLPESSRREDNTLADEEMKCKQRPFTRRSVRIANTQKDNCASYRIEKPFACLFCPKEFSRNYHLKLHMRIHSMERPHTCKFCRAQFSRKDGLLLHKRTHSGERPYHCLFCGARFVQKVHLRTHMNTHLSERYSCSECDRQFSQEIYLVRHRRIHTGERPYSCPVCRARFANTSSASRHMRIHTGKKPFACAGCGVRYALKDNLKLHVRKCSSKRK
ncbi:zinc finger protein 239-like [Bacillus rossius redtenbacheri]|uniref:zinc finger protein 239-like n=1 Tax=Bacillus rossius redtenbacheri TaxID=93214 RepID=UPI002FDEF57F